MKYLLRKCEIFADANVGKFHFTLRPVGAIFHNSRSELFHIRRKPNISLKAFDSEAFRNFVDAFRAFRVCRQIRAGETVEMFTKLWYNKEKKGGENMDKKMQIAINTHLWLPIVLFMIFMTISISCISENEIGMTVGFLIAALLPIFVFLISPIYYVFSEESITITYLFGQKEEIKWNSIRSITLYGSWISRGGATPHYHVAYPTNKKRAFFINGDISKTRKTKRLIKKYYKKNIV